jgi:phosphoglycolate phosphatase
MHLVANAVRVPAVAAALPAYPNVVVEDGALGAGWAAAVHAALPITAASPG